MATEKIKAGLIELHVGNFASKKDAARFQCFADGLHSMGGGIAITPLYSEEGVLMSFTVDSARADEILTKIREEEC